jgi:PAS domain S-box-containing protein
MQDSTAGPSMPNLVNVRGTELLASDTRERYREKIARITLDSMVQFVGLLDAEGTVLEINQVALDGVGIQLSDVEGRPFWTTFWWQVSPQINAELREMIRRAALGEFVRWDAEIYGRSGGTETIIIDASLMPVKDEHGKVVFIAAEGRDITEKKAQEREIARQREELARLDELKTAFFANISHEFRTPLTLMLGPLEDSVADGEEELSPRQRERITMAQRNGLRLQKLVNALLDFSRVEAGRIQAVYQPTDLASLTHDLASSFRAACEKAGLKLSIDTPKLSEPVFVDHEMWEKIVLNLLSNAFKFTLQGGIKVELSEQGGHAVLRVGDTGTGIPESELPLIFDRFHRVEGARGRTYEGTGIGLALVKELIELHKGEVSVESTVGKGTTFAVRLPFGHGHLPQHRLEASRTQASTATRAEAFVSEALRWLPDGITADEPGTPHQPRAAPDSATEARARVLLADDNADMRDYLSRLLAGSYEVSAAADGEEALAAARRARPDLILTDVMMPGLDGFGLLEKLRDDPELRGVPVIVLSARAGDEAKVEGLRRGADDYLVKPFSARELLARIAANIKLSRTRAQSASVLQEEVAERRRAEAALRERESELARVQQIAKVAGIELDLRDGFRNEPRSPEYRAIHGLPPDTNDGHEDWIRRLHPDDRERAVQSFRDAIAGTEQRFSSEYRIIRPSDGQVRWIAVEARIERDPDGRPLRLVGAHIDITDRVFSREMLRESEERFRLIANSAPVPMWVSTLVGTRAFANQAYLDFLGVGYEDALVFDWRKVLHPEDLPRILKEQVAGESSLKPFALEARYRRADGEWRWMRSESQPRWDPAGKHIGFIGVAHDITAAKLAEIELRHLNESLSVQVARRTRERDRIWNVSQDLLLVLDQQGHWLSINPAWAAAVGWGESDLLSSSHPASQNRSLSKACAHLTQLLLAGKETRFDVQFPHRDATRRWISWTATMDEAVIYAVGRDVTAEREAQETLRMTEEALRQSQKLEAMGQLTGGVAHDFNNLLMPIIGSLDMLQRRHVGGEREQRLIGGALQSADRAKTLVQRLLAFARRQPLQPVAVDVAELVTGMAQLIESTTGPQIQVVVDVATNVPLANADPNQLEMAILNLSVNARDAMTQGGTLRISASPELVQDSHRSKLKPGSYVRISVADTGIGMDETVLARAIEPFFSTKGVGKGTGLGLSMVHGLATQLGGSLSISSKPGLGTNVELWLPVSDKTTNANQVVSDTGDAGGATGTALLVDDDDMVRMSTADMLVEMGFSVLEANSAEEALKIVDSGQPFDLLITDHLMPGMTGVDLSHAVRVRRPETPVLIISGFAEAEGIASDLPRLTKPFRQAELAATVSGLLP